MSFSKMLEELAIKYNVDKVKQFGHDYIPGYTDLFSMIKNNISNLLEIGIGCGDHETFMKNKNINFTAGNSLKMWQEYFTNANIYGIDILSCDLSDQPRIKTFVADQSSETDLMKVVEYIGKPLDIIIDDGSHQLKHQVYTFLILSKFLSKGGIYIIEDVLHAEDFKSLNVFDTATKIYIKANFEIKWYDTRNPEYRFDDSFLMVFIKK